MAGYGRPKIGDLALVEHLYLLGGSDKFTRALKPPEVGSEISRFYC
jgi:hypothetical protein